MEQQARDRRQKGDELRAAMTEQVRAAEARKAREDARRRREEMRMAEEVKRQLEEEKRWVAGRPLLVLAQAQFVPLATRVDVCLSPPLQSSGIVQEEGRGHAPL